MARQLRQRNRTRLVDLRRLRQVRLQKHLTEKLKLDREPASFFHQSDPNTSLYFSSCQHGCTIKFRGLILTATSTSNGRDQPSTPNRKVNVSYQIKGRPVEPFSPRLSHDEVKREVHQVNPKGQPAEWNERSPGQKLLYGTCIRNMRALPPHQLTCHRKT